MKKYNPDADLQDGFYLFGDSVAETLVHVLKNCGDDLTRENVMRQAANIRNLELPMLIPGIRVSTSPTNDSPVAEMQLARFDGERLVRVGEIISRRD